jgi:hypothetical protein
MSSSQVEIIRPAAIHVVVTADTLTVDLMDGRTISVPVAWYPRLAHGSAQEQERWRQIGHGEGKLARSRRGHQREGTSSGEAIGREPAVARKMADRPNLIQQENDSA